MKRITFFLLISLSVYSSLSQENGVVYYSIASSWSKQFASCEYLPKTERDRMVYTWGGDRNEWTEKAELTFNAEVCIYEEKENEDMRRWRKFEEYKIYRDLAKNETFEILTLLNKQYLVQDSISCQNWKIRNEMKEIAGHICMSASYKDTLKGKEVIAWFALDFPVPIGPDKYCGLPGIILEVNEANGAKIYTATSLLLSDEKVEIVKPAAKKNRKVIDSTEYISIINKYINECEKLQRPYFWSIPF